MNYAICKRCDHFVEENPIPDAQITDHLNQHWPGLVAAAGPGLVLVVHKAIEAAAQGRWDQRIKMPGRGGRKDVGQIVSELKLYDFIKRATP